MCETETQIPETSAEALPESLESALEVEPQQSRVARLIARLSPAERLAGLTPQVNHIAELATTCPCGRANCTNNVIAIITGLGGDAVRRFRHRTAE
jgi:hypothetical protein